jgi:hypothetical protein
LHGPPRDNKLRLCFSDSRCISKDARYSISKSHQSIDHRSASHLTNLQLLFLCRQYQPSNLISRQFFKMVDLHENVYARRGTEGRAHIPAMPFWVGGIRVFQLVLTLLVMILCAYSSSVFGGGYVRLSCALFQLQKMLIIHSSQATVLRFTFLSGPSYFLHM